jgi:hypothetical protein
MKRDWIGLVLFLLVYLLGVFVGWTSREPKWNFVQYEDGSFEIHVRDVRIGSGCFDHSPEAC